MQFNLIGPGRVGLALAHALIHTGQYTLNAVYHPTMPRAQKATTLLGQGTPYDALHALPHADITFITTQDQHIELIAHALDNANHLKPKSLVVHMSGILSSNILMPLKTQDVIIGSLHPLKAFAEKERPEPDAFQAIDCAIEGEQAAIALLKNMVLALGANDFLIHPEQKASYHAAAIMASNYLVTLAAEASHLLEQAGVPEGETLTLCTRLMQTSLNNLKQAKSPEQALTGPLMRGDIHTIQQHLDAVQTEDTKALYQAAGLTTLALTDLTPECSERMKALFTS